MVNHVVISVLGKDRPGIVAAITSALFAAGCNIEDSSMTSLRNEFAMILMAALPQGMTLNQLQEKLGRTGRKHGLTVALKGLRPEESRRSIRSRRGKPYVVSVYGADKPGIVYHLSQLLSRMKINITDVQTKVLGSEQRPVYAMFIEIDLPPRVRPAALKSKLSAIAVELKVTVSVNAAESQLL